MSERLSSSSQERYELDPDTQLMHEARDAAYNMLRDNPEDVMTREIAEKLIAKADIKDRVRDLSDGADDVMLYQEFKRLGIFVVRDATATFDFKDEISGLSIKTSDSYLDLHLPPVSEDSRSRDAVEDSLRMVAEYIAIHQLEAKYIMGITYEKMARLAKGFGFHMAIPDPTLLPEGVVRGVEQVFERFTEAGQKGESVGVPAVVWLSTDELFDRVSFSS